MNEKHPTRKGASAPMSLRLTAEERLALKAKAKGMSLSAYIRGKVFPDEAPETGFGQTERLSPIARQQLLARTLAGLGQSRIHQSLSELAEAARLGVLPLTPDVLAEIRAACAHVRDMRKSLLQALGLRPEESQ